ncbi:zinc finger protein RFP-like isoform X2 [Rhineura floridana]|uniref:zinc finger protein RFP-like isoform X2 n=1 Tax=Rhineura floridana TaxID=261503 RepID=UPI002AC837C0|nr:zinc finger protein RFP-like isoform X2 [Rhineura floridana]
MAATGGPVQDLCEEATCPICLEYFQDPVCGHNFCKTCLSQSWGEAEMEAACPQCRLMVQQGSIRLNWQLANVAEIARKLSFQVVKKEMEGKGRVCEKPQEHQKLFHKDDETPISQVCDKSKEHENHKEIPLEEAFQEYKRLTETERQKIVDKFRQLHQFLEEQEQLLLAQMGELEKEIAKKRDDRLARLSEELSALEKIIWEMKEKHQQPASELLQDVRNTLLMQRSEKIETFEDPVAFPPGLKRRIWDLCDINPLLESVMKKFEDTLLFKQHFQRANVTLDPDTAHPLLLLSKDRKSVRWEGQPHDLPSNPKRFDEQFSVLGHEGFTAGKHFWEVVVGNEGTWAMGVARKSLRRKGYFAFSPEEGVWAIGKSQLGYIAYSPPDYPPLFLSEDPKRLQVTLNYGSGQVSFLDADTGTPIYTFTGASFSGETLLPFFHLWEGKTHLRIA